ncbi:hypothetical protein [Glutamicibacter sp. NPDC090743]|uniref:hypothetical protein n=1 Tax=Glutamicibacter sp. NPDC090743 TaxID=3364001 RepID=UPI0037F591CC
MKRYIDCVEQPIAYSDVDSFDRCDALFPAYQNSPRYQAATEERNRGSIAWGAALVARSYLLMFKTTKDERFLRKFIGHAEQILLSRDSLMGLKDYKGYSGPVWSSGRPYTTNSNVIQEVDGPGILEVRSKNASYLKILQGESSFSLEFFDESNRSFGVIENVNLDQTSERYITKVLSEQNWKQPLAAAKVSQDFSRENFIGTRAIELKENFYTAAVETGQICASLLEFCQLVRMDANLSQYESYAQRYTEISVEALNYHSKDICTDESGIYIKIENDAPYDFESTDAPLNHTLSIARCFILLYSITNEAKYRDLSEGMIKHFVHSLSVAKSDIGDSYTWPYFSVAGVNHNGYDVTERVSDWRTSRIGYPRMEDISHAIIAIEACVDAAKAGIIFRESDLKMFANTFMNNILDDTDSGTLVSNYVDGSGGFNKYVNAIGRWGILSPWHAGLWDRCHRIMNDAQPELDHATVLYGMATLMHYRNI